MPEKKEWTLMFYMASDNPLATSIVSQLKALKDAGFHHEVNVIAQFDPFTEGTPTHIFDVNLINKLKQPFSPNIGFAGNESFVRNLIEDKLWRDEKREKEVKGKKQEELVREAIQNLMETRHNVENCLLPRAPDLNGTSKRTPGKRRHEMDPYTSLRTFLDFCSQKYPAEHYMLFMLGHGVVLGNDVFMFDQHAEKHSITLSELGEALSEFNLKIKENGATFELVSFHSCSVSSLEVAYELKGTANYMLASQAPAFVGSWPYRQIVVRVLNEVGRNKKDPKELISDIFSYCVYNSADYLLAGYSHHVSLCDLNKVAELLQQPMGELSRALFNALNKKTDADPANELNEENDADPAKEKEADAASKYVLLYAHWRAQSFFDEMYIDLYDFCHCIVDRCERIEEAAALSENPPEKALTPELRNIKTACIKVLAKLASPNGNAPKTNRKLSENTVVAASEFVGPAYQYSHGLSVYFPWVRPSEDSEILEQYETYKFHQEFKNAPNGSEPNYSWLDFLETYFERTLRETKRTELNEQQGRRIVIDSTGTKNEKVKARTEWLQAQAAKLLTPEEQEKLDAARLQEDMASLVYRGEGPLGGFALKSSPSDRTGGDCTCPGFKNYPRDTRASGTRRKKAPAQRLPVSDTLLGDF